MNVGQLKESLAKLSNDCEVILVSADGTTPNIDILCATGYMHVGNRIVAAVVGMTEIQRRIEAGETPRPLGYSEPEAESGEEWKNAGG